jgi:copper chaperone CopZ
MSQVHEDHLVIIAIEGMHCHKCEQTLKRALQAHTGVHEVEVDFPTRQASVLFDKGIITVKQLMDTINSAGYHATGYTQRKTQQPA